MSYPKRPRLPSPDPESVGGADSTPIGIEIPSPRAPQAVSGAPRIPTRTGGPEMWDRPGRNVFSATEYPQRRLARPRAADPSQTLIDQPVAVERLDSLLADKMKTLLPETVARDPFWSRYSELRKGVAAEMFTDVLELLETKGPEEEQLDVGQQQFVDTHPITTWLNWIRPGRGHIIGK